MTTAPKRHHWWPICHSTLWKDDEGCITSIGRNGHIVRTSPANTAVIGHYNSIRKADGGRDSSLETFLANDIDDAAGPVLRKLATERIRHLTWESHLDRAFIGRERGNFAADGFRPPDQCWTVLLSPSARRALARYVASMLVRVPSYKDELNSQNMLWSVGNVLGVTGPQAIQATDELHVEIVLSHLEDYARRLDECAWMLVASPHQELIFGDTPVIPAALGWGEAEAIFPISPERALLIVRGHRPPVRDALMIVESMPKAARSLNKTMIQNAERQIFCRTQIDLSVVGRHLGTRQVRLQPNLETAAGRHNTRGPMLG